MKKIFNFRPLFIIFIVMLVGIYFSSTILKLNIYLNIGLFIFATILIILLLTIKPLHKFKAKGVFILITFLISIVMGSSIILSYKNLTKIDGNYMKVDAVVTDKIVLNKSTPYMHLRNISLNGKKYSGKLVLKLDKDKNGLDISTITPGCKISFSTSINVSPLFSDDASMNYEALYSSEKFSAFINTSKITVEHGKPNLFESIRIKTRANLHKFISNDKIADSCYAVLFGDKTVLDYEIYDTFKLAGVAHLLAISGLHISLLIAILFLLFKIFHVKKLLKFIISSAFLLVYCFLAGFTPSVCRASIVICVYLLASLLSKRTDKLNALSLAGIIVILFNPFICYSLSFIMSFTSIFGIFTLFKPIKSVVSKIKFLSNTAISAISMTLAVNFALIPLFAVFFREIYFIGFISNLFMIPLFTLMFTVLFISTLLGLIFSYLGAGIFIAGFLFELNLALAKIFALVPSVIVHGSLIVFILSYLLLFLISGFSFLKAKTKIILISCFSIILASTCALYSLPTKYPGSGAYVKTTYGCDIVQSENGKNVLILDSFNGFDIKIKLGNLRKDKYYTLSAIIIVNEVAASQYDNFIKLFSVDGFNMPVYLCSYESNTIENLLKKCPTVKTVNSFEATKFNDFYFTSIIENGKCYGLRFTMTNFNFLYINKLTDKEINFVKRYVFLNDTSFISTKTFYENMSGLGEITIVSENSTSEGNDKIYVTNMKKQNFLFYA